MRILWIFAHPDRGSLNGSLLTEGLRALDELGHQHQVSDLYAMGFKAVLDADDMNGADPGRLLVGAEQERAFHDGGLSQDILAEQAKIAWADVLVLQFPLWWFGPPAILKGWFDRVLVQGFAFGLKDADGRTPRYGDGGLAGKRTLVVTSVGARESAFGPRGIHGQLDEVLFPVLHGVSWYTGMAALPPFAVYGADRHTAADFSRAADALRARLRALDSTDPLPYRHENGGDYDENLVLRPEVAPGRTGIAAQLANEPHALPYAAVA
ncbi:NAD(P)H-dependent oxidoreductase [Streptomyces sp. O3]